MRALADTRFTDAGTSRLRVLLTRYRVVLYLAILLFATTLVFASRPRPFAPAPSKPDAPAAAQQGDDGRPLLLPDR